MPGDAEGLVVRPYRAGDEAAILDLFARSFHQPRTPEHWRWKFQENPFGHERISVAFVDGRLAGHYAAYPVRIFAQGTLSEAHQVGDTMTDPAIRHIGRGPTSVLGRTARHFYDTFCAGRVAFNYGFNVANIQKFSIRFLGSDLVEPVAYRYRDVRARPLPPLTRLERWARGWRFELVREVTQEWDELFRRVASRYGFLVARDAAYVRWRYLTCPDVLYAVVAMRKWGRLAGWLVFRIRDGRFSLGDLLLDSDFDDALEVVLRHLVPMYAVDAVEGWFPDRPAWMNRILESAGLEARPEPQDLGVMCVPFVMADAPARMRESLYYTMGDSDLF